jgi:UDP-N-acetylglucosamine 4-epimerase
VYQLNYDFNYIGLRYFNVFGKRQDPNGAYAAVIPKFIQQFLDGQSPIINGDGSNTRDFTYIENVLDATMKALFNERLEAQNQIYNVAFGASTSLNEMAAYIKSSISNRIPEKMLPEVNYGPFRKGDIPHSLASVDKIHELLGYTPRISVQEGIQKTVDWMLESQR